MKKFIDYFTNNKSKCQSKCQNLKNIYSFYHFNNNIKSNLARNKMRCVNNMSDVKEDINKKYNTINELKTLTNKIKKDNKLVITFLYILFFLINSSRHYNTFNFVIM